MSSKKIEYVRFYTEVCNEICIAGDSIGKIDVELDKKIISKDYHIKHLYMEIDKKAQFYDASKINNKLGKINIQLSDEEKEPAFVCFDVDESNNSYKVYDEEILFELYDEKLTRELLGSAETSNQTALESIWDVTDLIIRYDDGSKDFFWLPYNGDMETVSTWIDTYKNKEDYGFLCVSASKKVFDYISQEDAEDVEKLKSRWETSLVIW